MKHIMLFMAAAIALAFAGCASVDVVDGKNLNNCQISASGKTVAHLQATNWGLYFFMFPLLSGSTGTPGKTVFFEDSVTVESVVAMMTAESKKLNASSTLDLVSVHSTNPFMFGFKEVSVSGNAVK